MTAQDIQNQQTISLDQILSHGSVPTLPVVAMQLLEMTSNPDVSLNEIAVLIQSDPGLASKVLKTVNSSFYGLSKPCPSIERAIVILGLKAIKSLVLGFSMVNLTKDIDEQIDLGDFWQHTILAAVGARQIAQDVGMPEPDEVFAAALMQDIGVLAMLAVHTEQYAPLIIESAGSHAKLLELEQQRLGLDHVQVGTAMAEKWRMPAPIVVGIRHHHDKTPPTNEDETLVKCIVVGELAASAMAESHINDGLSVLYSTAKAWFDQVEQDVEQLIDKVQQSSKEVAKLLQQQIGDIPSAQELMNRANERLFETQLETQREADQAKRDAVTDGLTGISNRMHFDQVIAVALADAVSRQAPIAVLFSDADKFKFVNDTYGHPCGDAVLIELAKRVSETVGVACWKPGFEDLTAEQLTQRADKAVYTAKESGRNNVKCWGTDTGRRAADQRADEAAGLDINLDAVPSDGKTQVLLIEDDPLAARLIQSMLEKQSGVSVDVQTDGREAIEYLRDCQGPGRRNPDLIISDINIPGYNGLQIIRALRSNVKFQQIPIVVVTATLDDALAQSCRDAGADNIYNKLEISADLKGWCSELIHSLSSQAA